MTSRHKIKTPVPQRRLINLLPAGDLFLRGRGDILPCRLPPVSMYLQIESSCTEFHRGHFKFLRGSLQAGQVGLVSYLRRPRCGNRSYSFLAPQLSSQLVPTLACGLELVPTFMTCLVNQSFEFFVRSFLPAILHPSPLPAHVPMWRSIIRGKN